MKFYFLINIAVDELKKPAKKKEMPLMVLMLLLLLCLAFPVICRAGKIAS